MGRWTPQSGTMYRTLLDQCIEAFEIPDVPTEGAFICYGSPSGYDCDCVWDNGDFVITIRTPQSYGCRGFIEDWPDLKSWLSNGRYWKKTTGFLNVSRRVQASSPHFEWIDPKFIAHGFGLSASPNEIHAAESALRIAISNDWLSPQLRRDGCYEFVSTSISDPRAIRLATLFRSETTDVVVWEVQDVIGLGLFLDKPGFRIGDTVVAASKMTEAERIEAFTYEFELAGESSFGFSVARGLKLQA